MSCVEDWQALGMCKCHPTHTPSTYTHIHGTDIGVAISLPSGGQAATNVVLSINLLYDGSKCLMTKMYLSSIESCVKFNY